MLLSRKIGEKQHEFMRLYQSAISILQNGIGA